MKKLKRTEISRETTPCLRSSQQGETTLTANLDILVSVPLHWKGRLAWRRSAGDLRILL